MQVSRARADAANTESAKRGLAAVIDTQQDVSSLPEKRAKAVDTGPRTEGRMLAERLVSDKVDAEREREPEGLASLLGGYGSGSEDDAA